MTAIATSTPRSQRLAWQGARALGLPSHAGPPFLSLPATVFLPPQASSAPGCSCHCLAVPGLTLQQAAPSLLPPSPPCASPWDLALHLLTPGGFDLVWQGGEWRELQEAESRRARQLSPCHPRLPPHRVPAGSLGGSTLPCKAVLWPGSPHQEAAPAATATHFSRELFICHEVLSSLFLLQGPWPTHLLVRQPSGLQPWLHPQPASPPDRPPVNGTC